MTVAEVCCREVDVATPEESVYVAAQRMLQRNVGTLVVVGEEGVPLGILTDRDLVLKVVAKGKDPGKTAVADVMTPDPDVVREDWPVASALEAMHAGGFRRAPVVDDQGRLVGVLSVDDVLQLIAEQTGMIAKLVERESPRSLAGPGGRS